MRQGLEASEGALREFGVPTPAANVWWAAAQTVGREAGDHRVLPLEVRIRRIFQLSEGGLSSERLAFVCRRFMEPIFARAKPYPDSLPTLAALKGAGYRLALVSNSPWGSPPYVWREEIARHGLHAFLDVTVFCGDVGWRKPAPQIFEYTLHQLDLRPQQCLFIGDNPRWDIDGPAALGMDAVLIARDAGEDDMPAHSPAIRDLLSLCSALASLSHPGAGV